MNNIGSKIVHIKVQKARNFTHIDNIIFKRHRVYRLTRSQSNISIISNINWYQLNIVGLLFSIT